MAVTMSIGDSAMRILLTSLAITMALPCAAQAGPGQPPSEPAARGVKGAVPVCRRHPPVMEVMVGDRGQGGISALLLDASGKPLSNRKPPRP